MRGTGAALSGVANTGQRAAKTAYTKAIKVPDVIRKRNSNIDISAEGLALRLPVKGAGIERGASGIDALERQVGQAVDQSPATIRLTRQTMPSLMGEASDAQRLSAVDKAKADLAPGYVQQFFSNPNVSTKQTAQGATTYTPKDIPVRQVQDMKVRLNQMLANKFGEQIPQGATELHQAKRADLRANVAAAVPEVAPLNADLSRRYAVQDALEHRVPVAERHNVIPLRAGIGAMLSGGVGAAKALTGAVLGMAVDNPALLSQAAIRIDQAAKRLAPLAKTVNSLTPYANMATFGRLVASHEPAADEARTRGQLVTDAVKEYLASAEATQSPQALTAGVRQVVDDVSLLAGGVAAVTRTKDRAADHVRELWRSHTTEVP
jgi:hypothetical protein